MKHFHRFIGLFLTCVGLALGFTGCSESAATGDGASNEKREWLPETVSMARHIASVHSFPIGSGEDDYLRVEKVGNSIKAEFRADILEKLGGTKSLFALGWQSNPQLCSKSEYLFSLDALHALLAMNASEWRGDNH
jgi:hypothetical protein